MLVWCLSPADGVSDRRFWRKSSPRLAMAVLDKQLILLKPAADGGDALGVEAEPVHASDVARVLHLDAAIHDDRHAAGSAMRPPSSLITGTGTTGIPAPILTASARSRQRVRRAETR
jgi:hypothetical protein